ncbi:MAG: hypothetical protein ACREQZ_11455 [Woeseiaceae bacterium]
MAAPPHVLELPIHPKTADDAMRLLAALAHLAGQDPSLGFRRSAESDWVILEGGGETQLEIAIDRLTREFKLDLDIGQPQVAFRETITRTIEYDHTHRKQTGDASQFARLKLRFEPQPHASSSASNRSSTAAPSPSRTPSPAARCRTSSCRASRPA